MSENPDTRRHADDLTDASVAEDAVRATRRFDLRRILGGLFILYGVIVTIIGVVNHSTDGAKTGGIHINLWAGIAMLVAGVLFLLWDRLAPVPAEDILGSLQREQEEMKQQHD